MSKTPIYILLGVIISFIIIGCSQAPMGEVMQAKTTLENAKAVQADQYFPIDFAQISDSINIAIAEIDQQKKQFIFSRNFAHSKMLLENAIRNSEALIEKTDMRKEEISLKVRQLVVDVTTKLEEARANLELVQKNKQNKDEIAQIQSNIQILEQELAIVSSLIENKEYLTALEKATTHFDQSVLLNEEIQTAMTAANPKKARRG